MTKLPSVECDGMLNFFQNGPTVMFSRRSFELPAEINSIDYMDLLYDK